MLVDEVCNSLGSLLCEEVVVRHRTNIDWPIPIPVHDVQVAITVGLNEADIVKINLALGVSGRKCVSKDCCRMVR